MGGPLGGRRVLVTGASSGIGRATAVACAQAGARVGVLARREGLVRALAEELDGVAVVGDVTAADHVGALVDAAADGLGGLDGLVSCAGVMRPGLVADGDPADWRAMLDVNVLGLLAVTRAAIPHLRAAGPGASIVNLSSMSGRRVPAPTGTVYSATKSAVHAIGEGLRQELQPDGIRVTTVAPGFVDTPLFEGAGDGPVVERYRRLAGEVGLAAGDVAAAIVHVLAAPPSVTTVEVALTPTRQDDGSYAASVGDD